MFVPVWLIFLTSGLLMAIGALVWSLRSNQFDDQQRARYLPLQDLSAAELNDQPPIRKGITYYTNIGLMILGILSIFLVIYVMIITL